MGERPTVDQYFMGMTHLVKGRGTCPRRQVGAVIVKDKRVLTTGYNGAPRNFPHPIETGCLRDELQVPRGMMADICPCLHAEQNAILQAATTGVNIEGADLYCTTQPCTQCSRMIANCGITRVIFEQAYPDPLAVGILTTAGVQLWQYDGTEAKHIKKANTFEQAQDELRKRYKSHPEDLPLAPRDVLADAIPSQPTATRGGHGRDTAAGHADDDDAQVISGPSGASGTPVAHVRDLRDDPRREELIRQLALAKAEKKRKAAAQEPVE